MKKASSSRTSRQIKAWGQNAVLCAGILDLRKYKQDWNFLPHLGREWCPSGKCGTTSCKFLRGNKTDFRFQKYYIPLLVDVLGSPDDVKCKQRKSATVLKDYASFSKGWPTLVATTTS